MFSSFIIQLSVAVIVFFLLNYALSFFFRELISLVKSFSDNKEIDVEPVDGEERKQLKKIKPFFILLIVGLFLKFLGF